MVNGDNQFGCSPVTINFYNSSAGANSFLWNFGNGNTTITTEAPETLLSTFTKAGSYNVKLTASNVVPRQAPIKLLRFTHSRLLLLAYQNYNIACAIRLPSLTILRKGIFLTVGILAMAASATITTRNMLTQSQANT